MRDSEFLEGVRTRLVKFYGESPDEVYHKQLVNIAEKIRFLEENSPEIWNEPEGKVIELSGHAEVRM